MHGSMNVKFIDTKQAKEIQQYQNIKRKPYRTNAAIWLLYSIIRITICAEWRLPCQTNSR